MFISLGSNATLFHVDILIAFLLPAPGPNFNEEKLVVAVNWYGVSFQEGKEKMYLKLSYPEVTGVKIVRSVVFFVFFVFCTKTVLTFGNMLI